MRQALRASGVAILVPAAVAAAIALSVVGGAGGIGSLDDVLNGPAVPPAEAAAAPAPAARPQRDDRPRAPAAAVAPRVTQPRRAPRRAFARGRSPRPLLRPVTTLPDGPRPGQTGGPPPAAPSPGSPPAPAPARPHPVHDTGTQIVQAVRPLPVAGPVAAATVQAVVDLVDPPA
jgi:hypothetical protein